MQKNPQKYSEQSVNLSNLDIKPRLVDQRGLTLAFNSGIVSRKHIGIKE